MKHLVKLGIVLAVLVGMWTLHSYDNHQAVRKAETAITATYQAKLVEEIGKARYKEEQMQKATDQLRTTKDAQIKDINRKLAVALDELRKRTERPTDTTTPSESGAACTGAFLYREDAEFLAREAARADRILTERDYYYNQYESVRKQLEGS